MLLSDAKAVYVGTTPVRAVYAGTTRDWPIPAPVVKGRANGSNFSLIDPSVNQVGSPIATGDWMVLLWGYNAASALRTPTPVGPWSQKVAPVGVGTMGWAMWAGTRRAGDTTYTIVLSAGTNTPVWTLIWGSGAVSDPGWVYGAIGSRADSGNQNDVTAPSVNAPANSLALLLAMERTTATETIAQITVPAGWTKDTLTTPTGCAAFEAWRTYGLAQATGPVKITYPNPHASNAQAMLLALPPS